MIDFKELVKAGVHFGHQVSRWCPKMSPYIWGHKSSVHLIDVSKTATQLERAAQFLKDVAAQGKTILWIGTKKPAQEIIFQAAKQSKMPFVNHRWIGGTLSNYPQVKKSVTKLLHYEDIIARSEKFPFYTKKELNTFQKMVDRLKKNIGGIVDLNLPIGAVVIVDVRKERSALKEAARMGIPVVGVVDTNSDPTLVDYVVPGNDDAPRAIKILIDYLAENVAEGIKEAEKAKAKEKKEKEVEAVAKKEERKIALKGEKEGKVEKKSEPKKEKVKTKATVAVKAKPSVVKQRQPKPSSNKENGEKTAKPVAKKNSF